jgi:ribosomal protein S18 acetylase RimI-like enzyme
VTPSAASDPAEALLIRPVRDDEQEAVGILVEAAYAAGGLLDNDRDYGAHVRDVPGRAPVVPVLVAERDGRIVGSVTICPHGSGYTALAGPDEVEFRFLGVAPEAQGTGVARALVGAVEDYAAARGLDRLVLCVISDNVAAEAVYERLGFTRMPERDWWPMPEVHLRAWSRPVPHRSR